MIISASIHLLIHNILFLVGGLINVGVALFVFITTRKKRTVTATTFALSSVAVAVFQFSQLLGTNAPDAVISRNILMFNLTDIFIGMFMAHWFLGLIGKDKEKHNALRIIYATGIAMFIFFLIFPREFLIDSVPKLYFPYYYEPGPLYIMMFVWFLLVSVYHFYQLIITYRAEKDPVQKQRYGYVMWAMIYAYVLGTTAFLLVFNLPVDPAVSSFFGLYPIFLVYTILQYELFDIKILAKRAFVYAVTIFSIGILITALNLLNQYFVGIEPNFPSWVSSVIISVLLGGGGIYIWRKARDADVAKYEFITVVTHKFRTPLTRIRWAIEEIAATLPAEKRESVSTIIQSEGQLLELTNMLVNLSETDSNHFDYKVGDVDLKAFFETVKADYEQGMKAKNVAFNVDVEAGLKIRADQEKLRAVLQILLDNAESYTPAGGSVSVRAFADSKTACGIIEVTDTGIGMSKETIAGIFNRFYRGNAARSIDTEGMGIGLFMARNMAMNQGGSLSVRSEGEGKGSTFTVSLPLK